MQKRKVVIYEVHFQVQREIIDEYRAWLFTHIADILNLPGFQSAELFDVQTSEPNFCSLSVQYRLASPNDLENYFQNHAPRMRADGLERFGDRFSATRRVLQNPTLFQRKN